MDAKGRIPITHVGSLPRPQKVVDQVWAQDRGDPVDPAEFDRVIGEAVAEVVRNQAEAGVDFVSDGEMSKIGYATFTRHRLSGFELGEVPRATPADLDAFPRFRDRQAQDGVAPRYKRPICRGPIRYEHRGPLEDDLRHMKAALANVSVKGGFMNAPSPGIVALFQPNEHYKTREEYLEAIAEALRVEYEAIVAAGLYLQIDAPDLAMGRHIMYRDEPDAVFVRAVDTHVAVLNHALRNVPAERVRLHLCWGNYDGPHHCDIDLDKIIGGVLKAKPAILVFEAANPRHEHEWSTWRDAPIPDDKILAPGVISSTNNYIEHPRLIAERLQRFADIVGRDRVIAASDCGFGTWAGFGAVHPDICWAKLRSLAEGAARVQ
jgi:5-methyltetrahydropteroyltriglutamate--homocysteine methyltransferase